jgi:hypothetical protein
LPDARLNFAENLLRRSDDEPAIIAAGETGDDQVVSHRQLNQLVAQAARALSRAGITTEREQGTCKYVRLRRDELEQRFPGYRYGIVLILLLATFIVMECNVQGKWSQLVIVALQSATLYAALVASRATRRTMRVTSVIVLCAVAGTFASALADSSTVEGSSLLLNCFLVAIAPVVIARAIWTRPVIDVQTILGAICIYVLLGMLWAFIYQAIRTLGSAQFFAQTSDATINDDLYFSFVTITTVGYGDYYPVSLAGRILFLAPCW